MSNNTVAGKRKDAEAAPGPDADAVQKKTPKFPQRIAEILEKLSSAERDELTSFLGGGGRLGAGRREKVCLIGSGNWGSTMARVCGENVAREDRANLFEREIPMWVFEEMVDPPPLLHPGGNTGANLESISHRCHPILVAFVWELTKETLHLPLGCQGSCHGGAPPRPAGRGLLLLYYSRA